MDSKIIIVLVFMIELSGVFGLYITQILGEPSAIFPELNLDTYPARHERSIKKEGNTYGMSLTGDRGTVWNNLNDLRVSNYVGVTNSQIEDNNDDNKPELGESGENEQTADKIKYNAEEAASKEELHPKEPRINVQILEELDPEKLSFPESSKCEENLEKPSPEESSINEQALEELSSDKLNSKEQIFEEPSSEKSAIMQESLEKLSPPKLTSNGLSLSRNTYGMSLTGDHGMVWNDLNIFRKRYKIGEPTAEKIDSKFEDLREPRGSKLDEEINVKIMNFEKDLKEAASKDLNGNRVSYEVGKPTEESEENTRVEDINISTKKPDLDEIIHIILKPSEESPEDSSNKPETDAAFDDLDRIFDEATKEPETSQNDTKNALFDEIVGIIKEVFKNETSKLEGKANDCSKDNSSNKTEKSKDKNGDKKGNNYMTTTAPFTNEHTGNKDNPNNGKQKDKNERDEDKTFELSEDIRKLMENEQFWNWVNEWSTTYLELRMKQVDNHIKEEVSKQIEVYFTALKLDKTKLASNQNDGDSTTAVNSKDKSNNIYNDDDSNDERKTNDFNGNKIKYEELARKKRKDKDSENINKVAPVKVEANDVYSNSIGNDNIFIFNICNTISDLYLKKLANNRTNSFNIFGKDNEKINGNNKSNDLQANKDGTVNKNLVKPNESPDLSNNQDVKDTTEKETLNPIGTAEKNPEPTIEKQNETVELTTINPGNDSNENNDNVNDRLVENKDSAEKNDTKDTENEKETPKPDDVVEEKPENASEEIIDSITKLPETEGSKEKDDTENKHTENVKPDSHKSKEDENKETNNSSELGDNKDKDSVIEKEDASEDASSDASIQIQKINKKITHINKKSNIKKI